MSVQKASDLTFVNRRNKIHPQKLALWIACASILMMFSAWSSAHIVRKGQGNWADYQMPSAFFISTFVMLLSSVTLHIAFRNFKQGNEKLYKMLLIVSAVLGIGFVVLQYVGWTQLRDIGLALGKNTSGDFLYVISGFHAAHVLGGIAALMVALVHAFALPFRVTPKRIHRFDLTVNYWHFVDFLWIYLFLFLITQ